MTIKFPAAAIHSIKKNPMCKCRAAHQFCPEPRRSAQTSPGPLQQTGYSKRIISAILWCHREPGLSSFWTPPHLPSPVSVNSSGRRFLAISSQVQNISPQASNDRSSCTYSDASFILWLFEWQGNWQSAHRKQSTIWRGERCHIKHSDHLFFDTEVLLFGDDDYFPGKLPFCHVPSVRSDLTLVSTDARCTHLTSSPLPKPDSETEF